MSRDLEWAGVVGPAEWYGLTVVGVDELADPVGEVINRVELAVADESPLHDRGPQLHLVQPGGVGRGAMQEHLRVVVEERFDGRGAVSGEVVDDAVQLHPGRGLGDEIGEEGDEVLRPCRVGDPPGNSAVGHVERSEQLGGAVAAVLELSPHRDPRQPLVAGAAAGSAGRVGLIRLLAWIPVFSSTDHTSALSGGFKYSPQTSPALAQ